MCRLTALLPLSLLLAAPVLAESAPFDAAKAADTMLAKTDTDKSGGLSKDEWLAAGRRERGFVFMDGNKDGSIDKGELAAGLAKANERGMLPN